MKQVLPLVFVLLSFLLFNCYKPINIISDVSDAVFIAETYNDYKDKDKVYVYNTKSISNIHEHDIDFIITKTKNSNSIFTEMKFAKIKNKKREIINAPRNFKLISFSLPLIVIKKKDDDNKISSSSIDLLELRDISQEIILQKNGLYTFAFYPIDTDFSDVFESLQDEKNWLNLAGLDTEEISTYFNNHYGPVPLSAQLLDDHISYKYISSDKFFKMPYNIQSQFNIYLLKNSSGKIPVISPVYIARQANGIRGVFQEQKFISWLLSERGQKEIINYKQNYRRTSISSFIDGTLSGLWNTNTSILFNQNSWLFENQPLLSQIESN